MEYLWFLIVGHFIGDWALQNRWMAEHKHEWIEVLIAHCFIYTGIISIVLKYYNVNLIFIMFIFISHLVTDYWSSGAWKKKPFVWILYVDHLFHFLSLLIVWNITK